MKCFAKFFGEEALSAIHYMDKDWLAEPWARGAYTGVTSPGVLTSLGESLREPVGRIHWSGTETARVWPGYMEGALEAAERTAAEVDSRLQNKPWKPTKVKYPHRSDVPIYYNVTAVVTPLVILLVAVVLKYFM